MGPWLFIVFLFLLSITLVLSIVVPIFKNHHITTGDVINYDSIMRKFVYKVYMSEEKIISTLKEKSTMDELSCDFDFDRSVIKISEYGSSREYSFEIIVFDGYSLLKLNQTSLIGMQSHIPYKLNPFIVKKLNAELVPYTQYAE